MSFSCLSTSASLFDRLRDFWEQPVTERTISIILLWIYLLTTVAVELQRAGYFPAGLPAPPNSHFYSIQLAFTLILGIELVSLIFILPASLSKSMAKQLEILTLILLRNAFKELSILPEPVHINMDNMNEVINIAVSGMGALCVFLCLGLYRKIITRPAFLRGKEMLERYVQSKKLISLCLLLICAGIGVQDIYMSINGARTDFFVTIYTVLIFADIALALVAQCYMPCYYAVFRNSGFVMGTLLMRLALSAPPTLCAAIAVFSALYVLALTWGMNLFRPGI